MATSPLGGFADLSRYQAAAAQPNVNPLDALIQGYNQGQQLQQLPQMQAEQALARQLQTALIAQKLQDLQNPQAALQRELEKSFQEQLIKSSFDPLSGIRRAGVGAPPVGEIEPVINPLTGQETPFVRDLDLRRANLAKTAGSIQPREINGQLVQLNPQTGKYDVVFGSPKPEKSPFTQQTVVSLTDPNDVRQAIPDERGLPPAGYQFMKAIDKKDSVPEGQYNPQQLRSVNSLSDRFFKDDYIKKAVTAQSSLDIILQGLSQNNSAGDIAAINQFQSGMVDPGATVREGDISLLRNASPILARAQSFLPQLLKGGVIPPEMRNEIKKLSVDIYNMRARNANEIPVKRFKGNAEKAGIEFQDIGQEFSVLNPDGTSLSAASGSVPTIKTKEEFDALPPGSKYIGPSGKSATKR